jgi:hypothetical protein
MIVEPEKEDRRYYPCQWYTDNNKKYTVVYPSLSYYIQYFISWDFATYNVNHIIMKEKYYVICVCLRVVVSNT